MYTAIGTENKVQFLFLCGVAVMIRATYFIKIGKFLQISIKSDISKFCNYNISFLILIKVKMRKNGLYTIMNENCNTKKTDNQNKILIR